MGNAHEVLSYTVSADDKASAVFRGVGAEITKLANLGNTGLSGLSKNMNSLSSKKPLEFVKAEQAVQIARTEEQMAKLTKTTKAAGNATKLQAAEMGLLTERHKQLQGQMALTTGSHERWRKASDVAAVGVLAAGAAIVTGSVKQAVAWEKLGKSIEQQTGLSGKSMKDLMGTINNMTGHVPYKLNEVSQAAVILKQRFHETGPEIEKTAPGMIAFAKRAGQEVTPAVQGLSNVLLQYRKPLGDVTELTDKLVGVSQLTQQPLGAMESTIERFGPKLQAMGFGLEESIRLMGILGESGVKTEQMGRGLSAAYGAAQKQLGVTAANPHGNPQELLQKESLALQKAEASAAKYGETIPKTLAQQTQLDRQRGIANEKLDLQRHKYDELKKSIDAAGGSHATVSTIVQGEIKGIEHAKSSTEAYSLAASAFGKMVGPAFARAFYNNKAAIEATDKAMAKHGETSELVKREEESLGGKVTELDEAWHKTERTLGNDLVPTLTEFLKLVQGGVGDIEKFVHSNKTLAEILGGGLAGGAALTLLGRHTPLGGLTSKLPGPLGNILSPAGGGSWGVTGPIRPGSLTNPMMVRMEGGGKGGPSIPGAGGASSAENAASGGFVAGAKSVMGRVMKGGMIAGGGYLASELAGSAIGGKTGAAVSSIGGDAALGAGAGMLLGPEGAIAGGVAGALYGGFEKFVKGSGESEGQKVAGVVAKGMGSTVEQTLKQGLDRATREAMANMPSPQDLMKGKQPGDQNFAAYKQVLESGQYGAGQKVGHEIVSQQLNVTQGMGPVMQLASIVDYAKKRLSDKSLPEAARAGAVDTITAMVQGYEKNKQLPAGAARQLVEMVKAQWPGLQSGVIAAAGKTTSALATALHDQSVLEAAAGLVNQWRNVFPELPKIVGINSRNAVVQLSAAMGKLLELSRTGPAAQRAAATEAYGLLKAKGIEQMAGMRSGIERELKHLSKTIGPVTQQGTEASEAAYKRWRETVQQEMTLGIQSTSTGMAQITKSLKNELKEMMGSPTPRMSHSGPTSSMEKLTGSSEIVPGGATGGRVPGAVGPDNWTLIDPSGRPAARVGGGEILIGNRHTEARVDQMLAPYGTSLGREVAGEHTPHSAATGLRVRGPVSTFGPPGEPAGGTAYGKSSSEAGIAVNPHGGGNWNDALAQSLAMKVARISIAGHSADLRVIDKGPSAIGAHGPRLIDVTGAGVSALGMSYGSFPTDAIGEVVFGAGGTTVGGHGFGSIKAPKWTGPGGIIGQIGRAVLHRVAAAANAKLAGVHAPSSTSGLGTAAGAAPTGGGFTPSQLGTFDGLTVADWIIPELKYAQAHGWRGSITSGYRPGADPKAPGGSMHALDVYPGGAVDFGGESDPAGLANREAFLAATAGYTGSKLLKPIGFRDDGHLSGTGHALGGRVGFAGSFGQGGSVTASSPTMAIFGDKGTETATFIPHAATGIRLGSKGLGESVGTNPDTGNIEYHTQEEWAQIRLVHSSQTKHEALYRKAHPKAKKPLSPGKELEEDIREALGIAKSEPGKDISEAQKVGSSTTATLQKLLAEARKLHSKTLTAKLKGDIEGIVKHTGGMIEKLALENPTEAPAADKSAIAGLQKLMGTATAKGSKALTDTLIGDLLKVAQNWQKDIVSKLSKGEAHLTAHENLKIVNQSLAAIRSGGIGTTLPSAATDPTYLAAQKAAKEGEIVELTAERKALKAAEVKAHGHHNQKLVAALRVQMGEVDDAITGAKVDVGNLQIEYQKAVYEAFKKGIAEVDAGLQAHISQIQTGETLEEGVEHRAGKDFSGLEELKTKQEGVLTPAQIAQAKADYAAYKTHHEEQIKVDEEQRQHDIGSLSGLSGEDRSSMERQIEGLATSINTLQNQIYDQGKSTEKLTEATKENTKVLGGSVGFTFNGQQYVAGAGASQSSNSGADIALGI